jgi:hypothetical protein
VAISGSPARGRSLARRRAIGFGRSGTELVADLHAALEATKMWALGAAEPACPGRRDSGTMSGGCQELMIGEPQRAQNRCTPAGVLNV